MSGAATRVTPFLAGQACRTRDARNDSIMTGSGLVGTRIVYGDRYGVLVRGRTNYRTLPPSCDRVVSRKTPVPNPVPGTGVNRHTSGHTTSEPSGLIRLRSAVARTASRGSRDSRSHPPHAPPGGAGHDRSSILSRLTYPPRPHGRD